MQKWKFILIIIFTLISITSYANRERTLPSPKQTHLENKLTAEINRLIPGVRSDHYAYGDNVFEPAKGKYRLDCSRYIDHLLSNANPAAYHRICKSTKTTLPNSVDYYNFIAGLSKKSAEGHWYRVDGIANLVPGDIIVFQKPRMNGHHGYGHVMVVMSKPRRDPNNHAAYFVTISDSAMSGHNHDTRRRNQSGIGVGTILVRVHRFSGQPFAIAWKCGVHWEKGSIVLGRPTA